MTIAIAPPPLTDAELAALDALSATRFPSGPELVEAFVMVPRLLADLRAARARLADALAVGGAVQVLHAPTPADRTPTLPETPRARRYEP